MRTRVVLLMLLCVVAPVSAQPKVSFSFNQRNVSLTAAQNVVEKNLETQRLVLLEAGPVFGGFTGINHQKPDAWAIGTLPLRVAFWRVLIAGGAWIGTQRVPSFGTKANFAARLTVDLSSRLAFSWLHLSNASLGKQNPASDAFGLTWRLR
jgi:hypothetical protein